MDYERMKVKKYKKLTNVNAEKKAERKLVYWCHLFIRLRDLIRLESGAIIGKCISCGKEWRPNLFSDGSIMNGNEWHAGHLFKSNQYESVRYDEVNINGQHKYCNRQKHGDEANYTIGLIKKFGLEEYNALVLRKNKIHKFGILEIEALTEMFKDKAQKEAKRLGIKI
jgi:Bacteriophage Lambda NinG protein